MYKASFIIAAILMFTSIVTGQTKTQEKMRTTIGGYGQIDMNYPLDEDQSNASLDVHRVVLLLAHRFSDKVSLVTEIEFEHVREVYIEQAYLDYHIKPWLTFRGGLVLIPMGIINLYHESATFHSVERPLIDSYVAPTTWREIGAGFTGKFLDPGLQYTVYVVNGFLSYDGAGKIGGEKAFRGGRQKGAESIMNSPNFTGRLEYFGIPGFQLGFSLYSGRTQSTLFSDLGNSQSEARADSSVVSMSMMGLDARYDNGPWQFRAQGYYSTVANSAEYNAFTGRDMGSSMYGYYLEAAYDVLHTNRKDCGELFPYLRFSGFDTHNTTESLPENPAYKANAITAGLNFKPGPGTAFKIGYQKINFDDDKNSDMFQAGVAFSF